MHRGPPMSQELKNGFYPGFEKSWRRAELVGRGVMCVVVAATLAGLLGGGPATLWTSEVEAGTLRVEFPPVVRFGTPTGFTIHATPQKGQESIAITMPAALVKRYGLQSVTPRPTAWRAGPDGDMVMSFAVGAEQRAVAVEVGGMPVGSGVVRLSAGLDGSAPVSWSQVVLP